MIVEETLLRTVFSQLPPYTAADTKSYQIRYEWGSQKDLLLFIQKQTGNKYPLVWLEEGESEQSDTMHKSTKQARLFLAKNSENKTARNPTVWDSEFVDCLNPLLKNVITALRKSGVTTIDESRMWKVKRRANFTEVSNEDLAKAMDIWNVIVLDIFIIFTEKANGEPDCIKTIKF